jgi:hypothetical protein
MRLLIEITRKNSEKMASMQDSHASELQSLQTEHESSISAFKRKHEEDISRAKGHAKTCESLRQSNQEMEVRFTGRIAELKQADIQQKRAAPEGPRRQIDM